MIGESGLHRWRDPQCGVGAAEVVPRHEDSECGLEILPLLGERIREAGEAPHRHANGQVLAFDETGRDVERVWVASYHHPIRARQTRGGVAAVALRGIDL